MNHDTDTLPELVEPQRFRVGLPHQPVLEVWGIDRAGALRAYDEACGILGSDHPYDVEEVS